LVTQQILKTRNSSRPATTPDALRQQVLSALDNLKANDVRDVDVRGRTSIADWFVIASGTSNRHVRSIADEVVKQAKAVGCMPIGVEGEREGEWVLVDLGDVIVHVMLPRVREFYGLERLWNVDGAAEHAAEASLAAVN
jgi:ribosome-associated protein